MATALTVKGSPTMYALREATVPTGDWLELERCPVCDFDKAVEVGRVTTTRGDLGPTTAVCARCEHGFMSRRPSPDWFDRFYRAEWDARGRLGIAYGRGLRRPARTVHGFCSERLRGDESVLDAGAGLGDQLAVFRDFGFQAQGLERSEHRAAFVREQVGVKCATAALEQFEAEQPFDLVFSNHVLEHVDDPSSFIEHSRRLLAADGLLYVAVPNLWAEYPPQAIHFVPHLSMFTMASLRLLLARHGMQVIKSRVTRELQVLAEPTTELPATADEGHGGADFLSRIEEWVGDSVSRGTGRRRMLAWRTLKTTRGQYASRTLSGGGVLAFRAGVAARNALPAPIAHRVLPGFLRDPTLRSLEVHIDPGSTGLPIAFEYARETAPVWVK